MSSEDSQSRQRTAEEREAARHERTEARRRREAAAEAVPPTAQPVIPDPSPAGPGESEALDDEPDAPNAEPGGLRAGRPQPLYERRPAAQTGRKLPGSALRSRAAGGGGRAASGGSGVRAKAHSLRARIMAVAALVLLVVVLCLLALIFQPFTGSGHGRVVVSIPKGASAGTVAEILAKDGVVESSFFFDIRTFLDGSRGDLHAGTFTLKKGMSYSAAIATLRRARAARPAVVKVVIPEGETRIQIAETAKKDGLRGSYLQASRRAANFPPSHYGAPAGTPNLEGFLFPATYELDAGAPVSALVQDQLVAFDERFSETAVKRAKAMKLTGYQLLIVASMVEREAELPHDRPLVASVIYNRLRLGMTLGIDATIRFALNDYDKPLTEAQLHIKSPYNTRLHPGLPPTPISNPGVETIEAAAHPAHTSYLYYVAGADGCGDLVFADTYPEFERDSAAYDEALRKNGGRVPTCKKR